MNLSTSLPKALRRMRLEANFIDGLAIPARARECAESWEIEVVELGEIRLPRTDIADWLGCFEAHPHSDTSFDEFLFLTLAVQANHTFEVMVSPGLVASMSIRPADLFVFDPLKFHWLRADGDEGFLSIQWSIRKSEFSATYRDIRRGLNGLGLRSFKAPTERSFWKASIGENAA